MKNQHRRKTIIIAIMMALILFRLWLFMTMNWQIELESYYDSRLEIGSALDIATGKWMGPEYNKFILCKGAAFPIFLAISIMTRVPYPVCLFLLTVFSTFLFARAIKPVVNKKWVRCLIFSFLLYNPVGFGGEMAYPYRNALAPWLVLIILSCILAIYLRRHAEIKKLIPWAAGALLSTGFFWNLREDSMWILPFIIVGCVVILIHYFIDAKKIKGKKRYSTKKKILFVCITLCPIISIFLWNTAISTINYAKYGIYTTEDRTKTYEAKVLGKLIQIDDGADLESDYWVSGQALELAKEASPTLSLIDLTPFDQWPKIGDYSIWALRDSMTNSGYYIDAKTTNEAYKNIYNELEEGFKNGTLKRKSGIQLSDTSGLYSVNEIVKPLGIAAHSIANHVTFNEYTVKPEKVDHVRTEGDILLYENSLGINLQRTDEQLAEMNADGETRQSNNILKFAAKINRHISNMIIKIYNVMGWALFVAAVSGVLLSAYMLFKKKDYKHFTIELALISLGLILLAFLNAYLVGLWGTGFNLTADSDLFRAYTTPQTIILACFEIIGTYLLVSKIPWSKIRDRIAKLRKQ